MSRIMAVDPGEMTGWAIGTLTDGSLVIDQYGYDPWKVYAINLANVQKGENPFDIIVYESWRLRPQNAKQLVGSDFPSSQCIGAIKISAWTSGATLATSEPAYKPVIDRQMGGTDYLPKRDTVEHYRDAIRHICWYAVNKAGVDPSAIRYA